VNELDDLRPDLEGTSEQELHQLIERAHQIELLTQHPGWPLFRDYIMGLTVGTQTYVLNGSCKSFDEYAAKAGYVKGLTAAIDAPSVLLRRVAILQSERDNL
jgi:hypothetical protein